MSGEGKIGLTTEARWTQSFDAGFRPLCSSCLCGSIGLNEIENSSQASGAIAEHRWSKASLISAGTPFEVVEGLLERCEEKVFGTGGDAAAEDDELGVEDVDQGRNGSGEMADGGEPDSLSVCIACGISIQKRVRGGIAAFTAKADGLIADGVFEAAGRVEIVAWSVGVRAEMAEVAGAADLAGKQTSARVNRTTNTGAESEHEDIAAILRGSGPHFAE